MSEENQENSNSQNKQRPSKKPRRHKKGKNRKTQPQDVVLQDFAACPRCSYFWAGYKVIVGDEGIVTAVNEQKKGRLSLQWSHPMRELVHKSYGVRLDADFFHYESCCKECARSFAFQAPEEDQPGSFKIELAPLLEEI